MKKFLSKVLTLALVCAIVVTGTSITSEAKASKSKTSLPAANAAITEFVETSLSFVCDYPEYVVVNGQTMHWTQLKQAMKNKQVGLYDPANEFHVASMALEDIGGVDGYNYNYDNTNCTAQYYFYNDDFSYRLNDEPAESFCIYNPFSGYGFTDNNDMYFANVDVAKLQAEGASAPLAFAQAHGFTTIQNVYDYLVSIGVTFSAPTIDEFGRKDNVIARYNVNGKNIEISATYDVDDNTLNGIYINLIGQKVNAPYCVHSADEEQGVGYYSYNIYNDADWNIIEGQGLAMGSTF